MSLFFQSLEQAWYGFAPPKYVQPQQAPSVRPPTFASAQILELCARPCGFKNDKATRELLGGIPASWVSPRLRRLRDQGLIWIDESKYGQSRTYRMT